MSNKINLLSSLFHFFPFFLAFGCYNFPSNQWDHPWPSVTKGISNQFKIQLSGMGKMKLDHFL